MKLGAGQMIACVVVGIGFVFDAYEISIQGITVRPALESLGGLAPGSPEFNRWVGWLFYLPYLAGGIFGLLGGYLTDYFGRRRVLVWSIVLYGFATVGAAFATSPVELLLWRCLTIVGVCVEWVAALAWLAELFPERPRQREGALGFTQACSTAGAFLVAGVYYVAVTYADELPAIYGAHDAWRYTFLFGALPVVPVMLLRVFSPESPEWQRRKLAGTLRRPSFRALLAPELRRTTIVSSIMMASVAAFTFGVLAHVPRVVPGLSDVLAMPAVQREQTVAFVHAMQDVGNVAGRLLIAALAVVWLTRLPLLRSFQAPALVIAPLVFFLAPTLDANQLAIGVLFAALFIAAQSIFMGNYLAQAYPVHLRGTGESVALGIGGRVIGPAATMLTTYLANFTPGATPSEQLAYAMAIVSVIAGIVGLTASLWLPAVWPESRADKTSPPAPHASAGLGSIAGPLGTR